MTDASPKVVVVGDGPTGLSAALFLAKCNASVDVLGPDETPVHKALLHNYLGTPDMAGPDFVHVARGQAERHGARLHRGVAASVKTHGQGFAVETRDGTSFHCDYLVFANGRDAGLAQSLGIEKGPDGIRVDLNGRTNVPRAYAGGWLTRGHKIQAAISVGDGAAIALDILSAAKGKSFHDFDVLPPSQDKAPGPAAGAARPGSQSDPRRQTSHPQTT